MSPDALDNWLAALAGRETEEGNPEGSALRALIQAQPREALIPVAELDPIRESQLIARARAAGLLPEEPSASPPARLSTAWRWTIPRVALIAAALAGIAIGVSTLRTIKGPSETYRGAVEGVVELEASDPQALKQQLILELKSAGVSAMGYQRLNRVGLDADLPQPVSPEVRRVLERHHIPVPEDGVLVIEIQPPEKP
jgi:hypothetical protein